MKARMSFYKKWMDKVFLNRRNKSGEIKLVSDSRKDYTKDYSVLNLR